MHQATDDVARDDLVRDADDEVSRRLGDCEVDDPCKGSRANL